ncbi:MAG: helix-turn-helix domain-containing protein [Arsenophonus endosymbiont of Dermacentor nuttalli]
MFDYFKHDWYFTNVSANLQQSSTTLSDISIVFKVNSQTLVNTSIQSYSKDEQIITGQLSIHPSEMGSNSYLNMTGHNFIVNTMNTKQQNLMRNLKVKT